MRKYFTKKVIFFLSMLIFIPELAWSEDALPSRDNTHTSVFHQEPPPVEEVPQDFYSQFIHMLVILGLLIGFLIFATWVMKWLQSARLQGTNRSGLIKILESRQLSSRSAVHFIEILNKGIIIGESHAGLVRLAEMPLDSDDEDADEGPSEEKSRYTEREKS